MSIILWWGLQMLSGSCVPAVYWVNKAVLHQSHFKALLMEKRLFPRYVVSYILTFIQVKRQRTYTESCENILYCFEKTSFWTFKNMFVCLLVNHPQYTHWQPVKLCDKKLLWLKAVTSLWLNESFLSHCVAPFTGTTWSLKPPPARYPDLY